MKYCHVWRSSSAPVNLETLVLQILASDVENLETGPGSGQRSP